MQAPEIRKYLDVFQFLQDLYKYRKSIDPKFSYETWAQSLGIRSRSYLRLVVLGRRSMSEKLIPVLIANLKFDSDDADYFWNLVQYSQSRSASQKKIFGQKLVSMLQPKVDPVEVEPQFQFLSDTLLPKLQTLLSFEDVGKNPEILAGHLNTDPARVSVALQTLQKLGYVDDEGKPLKPSFKVSEKARDQGLAHFYQQILEEAKRAIELPAESRKFRSLFVALSSDEIQDLQAKINSFAQDLLSNYNFDEIAGRKLYQIHINAFPVSESNDLLVK